MSLDPYRASRQLEDHALLQDERYHFQISYRDDIFKVASPVAQKTLIAELGPNERLLYFLLKHKQVFDATAAGPAAMTYALHNDTDIFTGKTGVDGFVAPTDALLVDLLSTACDAAAPADIKIPIGSIIDLICEEATGLINFGVAGQVVAAATNAAAAVLSKAVHGLDTGCNIKLSGFTGKWAAANGNWDVTVTGAGTFSIPVDSTGFGAMAGAPVYDATYLKSGVLDVWLRTIRL